MQVFLDHNPNCLKDRNLLGLGCLHMAAEANRANVLMHLASYSLNINEQIEVDGMCAGQTPLHFAFKERNKEAINALLLLNANENIKDKHGRNPRDCSTDYSPTTRPAIS